MTCKAITFTVLMLILPLIAAGDHLEVQPDVAVPLFLKVITYDEHFDKDQVTGINVMVIYERSEHESYEELIAFDRFFEENSGLTVRDVDVHYQSVRVDEVQSALNDLSESDYNVAIVTKINRRKVEALLEKTSNLNVRTFSIGNDYIPLGIGVALNFDRDKKRAVQVNLAATQNEGSKFSAHLLKMCQIWEK